VLIAIIVLIVLSSLGIDIGPLLAGAGVVGLAVGLGSQRTIAEISRRRVLPHRGRVPRRRLRRGRQRPSLEFPILD
jgi:hypothetical protein